ncbi:MAG TPA: FKBP-type peptidyl-prolyl cis-trans isomerase [Methanoregula sp.]|nr:FKBP-type peptidyl-prolyl cis-trans isomerase [Methanoregula sp.]
MKKSEKEKGKEATAARRKQLTTYGIIVVIAAVIICIVGYLAITHVVAKSGDTVGVYYTGTLDNGTVFDSNVNETPLVFTLGSGQMIPGFDKAVTGMAVGDTKTVHIPVDQAYGPYHPELVTTVNRSANFSITNPYIGEILTVENPDTRATTEVKIINVTPSTVTVDANFLLAGQNLTFTINLVSINPK